MYTTVAKQRYIGVAGTLAAGKSTLTKQLGDYLDVVTIPEPVSPYLADFYKDNDKWAFHMQVYMMSNRAKGALLLSRFGGIQDRTIYEDRIFQKVLYQRGSLSEREYDTCTNVYHSISKPRPDLIIYLQVSPETCIQRQKDRARVKEVGIQEDYMVDLVNAYDDWATNCECKVITIPWDNPLPVEDVAEIIDDN